MSEEFPFLISVICLHLNTVCPDHTKNYMDSLFCKSVEQGLHTCFVHKHFDHISTGRIRLSVGHPYCLGRTKKWSCEEKYRLENKTMMKENHKNGLRPEWVELLDDWWGWIKLYLLLHAANWAELPKWYWISRFYYIVLFDAIHSATCFNLTYFGYLLILDFEQFYLRLPDHFAV